jgi:hypothetical protein
MEEKRMKKLLAVLLVFGVVTLSFSLEGWAQTQTKNTGDDLPLADLFMARPLGVAAGIVGTGLFIVSLPFTIPTRSTDKAAKMLISDPFRFSFSRPFPDESLDFK